MSVILALALKDLRLLVRDKGGLFFTFAFPFLVAIFFGAIFSSGAEETQSLPVLVVDEDGSEGSESFLESLRSSEALAVETADRDDAAERVRRGERVAYVALLPGFGRALGQPFAGRPPRIELGVDPARNAEAGLLQGLLTQFAAERLQDVFADSGQLEANARAGLRALEVSGASGPQAENLQGLLSQVERFAQGSKGSSGPLTGGFELEPVRIEKVPVISSADGPPSAYAISFPQGILWGILGCTAAFALSLVTERTSGTLVRLQGAPIGRSQVLLGKALACFTACVTVSVSLLIFGALAFGLAPDSWLLVAAAVVSTGVAFSGIMMLLATFGRTERAVSGLSWAALLLLAMLGGGMVPLFVMPTWMRTLSDLSPVKWSILSLEGALWRDFGWAEMAIPCLVLLTVGATGLIAGARFFRWSA